MTTYPEHEKLKALGDTRAAVQSFLDWLLDDFRPQDFDDSRCILAGEWDDTPASHDRLHHIFETRSALLAAYFGIDEAALEDEKDAMLAEFRRAHP
jgi:hypothetical protein